MSLFDLNHVTVSEGGDQHQNPTSTSPNLFRNRRDDCLSKQLLHHESKQDSLLLLSDESSHPLALHDIAAAAADCDEGESHGSDDKRMPSNMRIMKKMMMVMMTMGCQDSRPRGNMQIVGKGQSQADGSSSNNCSIKSASCSSYSSGEVVKVCTDCNTTRTPLWRTGPHGPMSLCNACGIRQRKARRAMEAAALKGGGGLALSAPDNRQKKEEKSSMIHHTVPFKKRCKFKYSSSSSSSVHDQKKQLCHEVLPKDERDAAMLLMGLSGGLLRSHL